MWIAIAVVYNAFACIHAGWSANSWNRTCIKTLKKLILTEGPLIRVAFYPTGTGFRCVLENFYIRKKSLSLISFFILSSVSTNIIKIIYYTLHSLVYIDFDIAIVLFVQFNRVRIYIYIYIYIYKVWDWGLSGKERL